MIRNKSFVKISKSNKVRTVVREHYLRDDIWCGCKACQVCHHDSPKLAGETLLILDTNVILHQMDLLEKPNLTDVVVFSVVLDEVQHRSIKQYQRLRDVLADETRRFYVFVNEHARQTYVEKEAQESPNDRNDRAIRVASKWYQDHLNGKAKIILLTNDMGNKEKAIAMGINAMTVQDYITSLDEPDLLDSLVYGNYESASLAADGDTAIYLDHFSETDLTAGVNSGKYFQGFLRQNDDNWLEATVQCNDKDILIKGRLNMNRAIDGDMVVAEIFPENEWQEPSNTFIDVDAPELTLVNAMEDGTVSAEAEKALTSEATDGTSEAKASNPKQPTGRVIGIVRRNWRPLCGSIEWNEALVQSKNVDYVLFVPINRRIPKMKVKTKQPELLREKRIVVNIDGWDVKSLLPWGHYTRILGPIGDKHVEAEAILLQYDIHLKPWSPGILAELPGHDEPIVLTAARLDLRGENIVSIDPPGCTDIDDALHAKKLPNGNFQVGVHIADVTHYVTEDSHLDKEAKSRGNTVYLVDKRIDMLPEVLSSHLCSLIGGVDRYAFSCLWEMTADAEIVNVSFHKSIIRSRHSFTYAAAQARMDDSSLNDDVTLGIRTLNKLARVLKQKRINAGALSLASSEVRFIKDEETHDPIDLEMYESKETNSLVEEFMLLANIAVAKQIVKFFPAFSLLRRHPEPKMDALNRLLITMERFGVHLDINTSKQLSESLEKAMKPDDEFFNKLLRIMLTRCMNPARYFSSGSMTPSQFTHYGLATPIYTHFTSPIRRYADVVVHRLLAASIGYAPLTPQLNQRNVQRISEVINRRHRMAELAGRDSSRYHIINFFKGKTITELAYIMKVGRNGLTVMLPRYGIEGKVYVTKKGEKVNTWVYDAKSATLTSPPLKSLNGKTHTFKAFNKITVQMSIDVSTNYEPRIVFECVDPLLDETKKGKIPAIASGKDDMEVEQKLTKKRKFGKFSDTTAGGVNSESTPKKQKKGPE